MDEPGAHGAAGVAYAEHPGHLPRIVVPIPHVDLALGQPGGPFMASVPTAPGGWSTYNYSANVAAGTFTISTSGDGTSVSLP